MSANASNYEIRLSDEQRAAVDGVLAWLDAVRDLKTGTEVGKARWRARPSIGSPQRFRLGGLAGTGKTTIIRWIEKAAGLDVAVCAFTGRAAYVLRNKGLKSATTIHRTIYMPVPTCETCGMAVDDFADHPNYWCDHPSVGVRFVTHSGLPYDLIIVDEASMVNADIQADLESYKIPVLYVGDHGQLEPIGDNPRLMVRPDVTLETVHRQAVGSPILELAYMVRSGKPPETTGPQAQVVSASTMPKDAADFDIVICGFNKERAAINRWMRRQHGRSGPVQEGDRIVCLRNDHDRGLFNGMLATVLHARIGLSNKGRKIPVLDVEDDMGERYMNLPYAADQFGAEGKLDDVRRDKTLWDYGYCLTAHKAQGGEWDRVLVLEQIGGSWDARRWRYTAVTRAAKELVYCVNDRGRRR